MVDAAQSALKPMVKSQERIFEAIRVKEIADRAVTVSLSSAPLATVAELNRELHAAGPTLVGNDELLRGVLAGCGDCIKVGKMNSLELL